VKTDWAESKDELEISRDRDVEALKAIKQVNHPNLIQCLAAVGMGSLRCFMFPWAEWGNLRDFWEKKPRQVPAARHALSNKPSVSSVA